MEAMAAGEVGVVAAVAALAAKVVVYLVEVVVVVTDQDRGPGPDQEVEEEVEEVEAVGEADNHQSPPPEGLLLPPGKSDGGPVARGRGVTAANDLSPPSPPSLQPTSHLRTTGLHKTLTLTKDKTQTVTPTVTDMTNQPFTNIGPDKDNLTDIDMTHMRSVPEALAAAADPQVLLWLRARARKVALQVKDPLVLFTAQELPILPATIPVAKRLRLAQACWRHVATPLVTAVISEGFRLQVTAAPAPRSQPPLSPELIPVVNQLIGDYQGEGALATVKGGQEQVFLSPIFVVPKVPTGHRLIHDLRTVNQAIRTPAVTKYDSVTGFLHQVKRGDWFSRYDIKHAFLHIPIHTSSQKFLGFCHEGKQYKWEATPFGLKTSPMVWWRVFRTATRLLKRLAIRAAWWVDDGITAHTTQLEACQESLAVFRVLGALGFKFSPKTKPLPTQQVEFMGYVIDSRDMTIRLSARRRHNLLHSLKQMVKRGRAKLNDIRRVLGQLAACRLVVQGAAMHSRQLQALLRRMTHLGQDIMPLDSHVILDLHDLILTVTKNDGRPIPRAEVGEPQVRLTTDASSTGWGGTLERLTKHNQWTVTTQTQARWQHWEAGWPAAVLETRALRLAARAFRRFIPPRTHILCRSDSSASVWAGRKEGAKSVRVAREVRRLWHLAWSMPWHLSFVHLQGVRNIVADRLSRQFPSRTDYKLHRRLFIAMTRVMTRHSGWRPRVDGMATPHNTQLTLFVSRFPQPRAWKVDFWSLTHSKIFGLYVNPPWSLLGRLSCAVTPHPEGMVVCHPVWPSATWYVRLMEHLHPDCPQVVVPTGTLAFRDATDEHLGPLRWPLAFSLILPTRQPQHRAGTVMIQ